ASFSLQMEKEVSEIIQDSKLQKKKYPPMGKIERSIIHDVAEVAGLTSFSFGEEEESRYVMIFKKASEFAPSDEELEAYRRGEAWDPQIAEEKRKLKQQAQFELEREARTGPKEEVCPSSNYRDKYSHLIGVSAAKEAAHTLEANKAYGCGEPLTTHALTHNTQQAQFELEREARTGPKEEVCPSSNYRDKYSHLIGVSAAKEAAHTLEANKAYGCVPVANKRDTRSIEEAMNAIRAKKKQKRSEDECAGSSSSP
ncbi:SPAG7 protein, partial [Polyodon spathula]|nr:SPAG7 protein [Polyodon spathula]